MVRSNIDVFGIVIFGDSDHHGERPTNYLFKSHENERHRGGSIIVSKGNVEYINTILSRLV